MKETLSLDEVFFRTYFFKSVVSTPFHTHLKVCSFTSLFVYKFTGLQVTERVSTSEAPRLKIKNLSP